MRGPSKTLGVLVALCVAALSSCASNEDAAGGSTEGTPSGGTGTVTGTTGGNGGGNGTGASTGSASAGTTGGGASDTTASTTASATGSTSAGDSGTSTTGNATSSTNEGSTSGGTSSVTTGGSTSSTGRDASVGSDASVQDRSVPSDRSISGDATASAGGAVWTNRYDNSRSGATNSETALTIANVSGGTFGLRFSRSVDGHIYGQPLYLPRVAIGGAVHNVVYVTTEHDSVYAFDADDPAASAPLWTVNLGPPYPLHPSPTNTQPVPAPYNVSCADMTPETGITSTPVIDVANGRLFVVAKTLESNVTHIRLHALDVQTGSEMLAGPVEIQGSVPGTGEAADAGVVPFQPQWHLNRPGLLLQGGIVYIAFSSHCDNVPYHGWVFGYDASSLAQKGIYNNTANGKEGGIWQSGMGLSANADGIFVVSGNGSSDSTGAGAMTGLSVVKLRQSASGLAVADFWTPSNADSMSMNDLDFTTAAVLVPQPNVILMGGKDGNLNVLDPTNLGKFSTTKNNILQSFAIGGHSHGGPVYWQSPAGLTVYIWPESQGLQAYRFGTNTLNTTPVAQYNDIKPSHPGGILSLSSNGSAAGTGILWATSAYPANGDAWHTLVPGALYAFNAETLVRIWSSTDKAGDALGTFAKFNAPTVANGKVYVGTNAPTGMTAGTLRVYGLN